MAGQRYPEHDPIPLQPSAMVNGLIRQHTASNRETALSTALTDWFFGRGETSISASDGFFVFFT